MKKVMLFNKEIGTNRIVEAIMAIVCVICICVTTYAVSMTVTYEKYVDEHEALMEKYQEKRAELMSLRNDELKDLDWKFDNGWLNELEYREAYVEAWASYLQWIETYYDYYGVV